MQLTEATIDEVSGGGGFHGVAAEVDLGIETALDRTLSRFPDALIRVKEELEARIPPII